MDQICYSHFNWFPRACFCADNPFVSQKMKARETPSIIQVFSHFIAYLNMFFLFVFIWYYRFCLLVTLSSFPEPWTHSSWLYVKKKKKKKKKTNLKPPSELFMCCSFTSLCGSPFDELCNLVLQMTLTIRSVKAPGLLESSLLLFLFHVYLAALCACLCFIISPQCEEPVISISTDRTPGEGHSCGTKYRAFSSYTSGLFYLALRDEGMETRLWMRQDS